MQKCFVPAMILAVAMGVTACAGKLGHVNKGFAAFSEDPPDYITAEAEFDAALKNDPNDPFAQLNLAAVYQNTGRAQLAVPLYEKVLTTGKGIRPSRRANSNQQNPTLAEMAQANLLKMQQLAVR